VVKRVAVEHDHVGTLGEERVGVGMRDDGLEHLAADGWVDLLVHLHHPQLLVRGGEVLELRDADLDGGLELREDDVGDEVEAALLRGVARLLEQPSPVIRTTTVSCCSFVGGGNEGSVVAGS